MPQPTAQTPGHSQFLRTGVLLAALGLAIALGGWRAATALTAPAQYDSAATRIEQRLTGLLGTLIGPGAVQVHIAPRPNGSRSVLVLVDDGAAQVDYGDEAITALVGSAIHVDALRGDTLTIQRASFASGVAAPSQPLMIEIGGYIVLCALIGFALLAREHTGARANIAQPQPAPAPSPTTRIETLPAPSNDVVAARMGEDPRQAAQLIRSWLRNGEPTV